MTGWQILLLWCIGSVGFVGFFILLGAALRTDGSEEDGFHL